MREIKFRAWQDGEFLISPLSSNYGLNRFFGMLYEDAPILQYTGLKDKNGKEIYEGDIVTRKTIKYDFELPDGEDTREVVETSTIVYRHKGFWVNSESFGWEGEGLWNWEEIEVIGNIYENPELLIKSKTKEL